MQFTYSFEVSHAIAPVVRFAFKAIPCFVERALQTPTLLTLTMSTEVSFFACLGLGITVLFMAYIMPNHIPSQRYQMQSRNSHCIRFQVSAYICCYSTY